MTMDGATSVVITLLGIAIGFAGVVCSSGITSFDVAGRRRAAICGALVTIGMTTVWCASSAGFAA